jgi:multidrug efflux pump subunit AcrA (membrane-fusion protein)
VELAPGDGAAPITAAVSRISPFLQQGLFSAEVEIDVPDDTGSLLPGMFVTVDIFYGESAPATLVPTSALFDNPATGEQGVYVSAAPPEAVPAGEGGRPAPVGVQFRPVEIVAQAPESAGVKGVAPGEWVVVVGQHLLAQEREPMARVRAVEWNRIMELQQLQREDLLREFMERQQRAETAS